MQRGRPFPRVNQSLLLSSSMYSLCSTSPNANTSCKNWNQELGFRNSPPDNASMYLRREFLQLARKDAPSVVRHHHLARQACRVELHSATRVQAQSASNLAGSSANVCMRSHPRKRAPTTQCDVLCAQEIFAQLR